MHAIISLFTFLHIFGSAALKKYAQKIVHVNNINTFTFGKKKRRGVAIVSLKYNLNIAQQK